MRQSRTSPEECRQVRCKSRRRHQQVNNILIYLLCVCINELVITLCNKYRFATDTPAELALVAKLAVEAGAYAAVVANHWAEGGAGAIGECIIP